jgi:hypothetical protein
MSRFKPAALAAFDLMIAKYLNRLANRTLDSASAALFSTVAQLASHPLPSPEEVEHEIAKTGDFNARPDVPDHLSSRASMQVVG